MIDEIIQHFIEYGCDFFKIEDKLYILPWYSKPIGNFVTLYRASDMFYNKKEIKSIIVRFKNEQKIVALSKDKATILHYIIKDMESKNNEI